MEETAGKAAEVEREREGVTGAERTRDGVAGRGTAREIDDVERVRAEGKSLGTGVRGERASSSK